MPNLVVGQANGEEYRGAPYFVTEISSQERSDYNDYVIGANSAQLLKDQVKGLSDDNESFVKGLLGG